jgi:hypothetical protein
MNEEITVSQIHRKGCVQPLLGTGAGADTDAFRPVTGALGPAFDALTHRPPTGVDAVAQARHLGTLATIYQHASVERQPAVLQGLVPRPRSSRMKFIRDKKESTR